jgi:hypothetical protein
MGATSAYFFRIEARGHWEVSREVGLLVAIFRSCTQSGLGFWTTCKKSLFYRNTWYLKVILLVVTWKAKRYKTYGESPTFWLAISQTLESFCVSPNRPYAMRQVQRPLDRFFNFWYFYMFPIQCWLLCWSWSSFVRRYQNSLHCLASSLPDISS